MENPHPQPIYTSSLTSPLWRDHLGGVLGTDTICAYRRFPACATGLPADSAGAGLASAVSCVISFSSLLSGWVRWDWPAHPLHLLSDSKTLLQKRASTSSPVIRRHPTRIRSKLWSPEWRCSTTTATAGWIFILSTEQQFLLCRRSHRLTGTGSIATITMVRSPM